MILKDKLHLIMKEVLHRVAALEEDPEVISRMFGDLDLQRFWEDYIGLGTTPEVR